MKTTHRIFFNNSNNMQALADESIHLIVTSPPYPMIEMWDDMFCKQNPSIRDSLANGDGLRAFELMNQVLDNIWDECYRVLKPGGLACINIGDATRSINGNFALYSSHARILSHLLKIGFSGLPEILWRKQTNAPNKFMGSGMLPGGAYVTLEHEFILIVRKGSKREFKSAESKKNRGESAYFWEERNNWFSDVWFDLKGTTQKLVNPELRQRSAAFPFEVPYRLTNMFSAKGDTVLDPFLGLGTSMLAAMVAGRNSVGFELDKNFLQVMRSQIQNLVPFANTQIEMRLENHLNFIQERYSQNKICKHLNEFYKFPVVTNQEKLLLLNDVIEVSEKANNSFEIEYADSPQPKYIQNNEKWMITEDVKPKKQKSEDKSGEQLGFL